MAGEEGFEPSNGGSKGRCLTTWRLPNVLEAYQNSTSSCSILLRIDLCTPHAMIRIMKDPQQFAYEVNQQLDTMGSDAPRVSGKFVSDLLPEEHENDDPVTAAQYVDGVCGLVDSRIFENMTDDGESAE